MKASNDFFDKIYKENFARVFNFIYSITNDRSLTEDITQEAFSKAYKNMESLRNESKISVWLNKIAYNLFLDFKRKKSPQLLTIDDESLTTKFADTKKNLSKIVEQNIMSECVQSKIRLLPENYCAPLLLDIHGFNNREIANVLGCSLENAKIRLHRARKRMKEILGKDCSFYYDERNVLC